VSNWLLLHGTPLTPSVWDGVIPLLAGHGEVPAPAVVPGLGPATGFSAHTRPTTCHWR
jgi:hypothetical protein